jgi:hypothetical protein
MSRNPVVFGASECVLNAVEGAFARERVCLNDDNPLGVTGAGPSDKGDGDGGRLGRKGGEDGALFLGVP